MLMKLKIRIQDLFVIHILDWTLESMHRPQTGLSLSARHVREAMNYLVIVDFPFSSEQLGPGRTNLSCIVLQYMSPSTRVLGAKMAKFLLRTTGIIVCTFVQ